MAKYNLTISEPVFQADAGTKGSKRAWSGTVEVDARKLPPEIAEEFFKAGCRQWLKNAAANHDKEADGLAAMRERLAKLYAGDIDRKYHYASPIERRALENILAALQLQAREEQVQATEEQLRATARAVLQGNSGQQWLDEAKGQLEAEAARAAKGAKGLSAALAALKPAPAAATTPAA